MVACGMVERAFNLSLLRPLHLLSMPSTLPSFPVPAPSEPVQTPQIISQGRHPTRAYGILIDDACLKRWGTKIYNELFDNKLLKMSPEEAHATLVVIRPATLSYLTRMVYGAFPNLPRLRRSTILMNDVAGTWLFVFKDNSSYACGHLSLNPEDVRGAKKLLGLQRQSAQWHNVLV